MEKDQENKSNILLKHNPDNEPEQNINTSNIKNKNLYSKVVESIKKNEEKEKNISSKSSDSKINSGLSSITNTIKNAVNTVNEKTHNTAETIQEKAKETVNYVKDLYNDVVGNNNSKDDENNIDYSKIKVKDADKQFYNMLNISPVNSEYIASDANNYNHFINNEKTNKDNNKNANDIYDKNYQDFIDKDKEIRKEIATKF